MFQTTNQHFYCQHLNASQGTAGLETLRVVEDQALRNPQKLRLVLW